MHRLGLGSAPDFYQQPHWALFMITVTYVWKNLGYAFVIYLAALQGKRADLDEAAAVDGASGWTHFRKVLLPQLRPTTFFLSITVLLNSLQVFDIINVMTRGGPLGNGTTTMVYQVYEETFRNFRAGYGATVATIMFLILLVVTVARYADGSRRTMTSTTDTPVADAHRRGGAIVSDERGRIAVRARSVGGRCRCWVISRCSSRWPSSWCPWRGSC